MSTKTTGLFTTVAITTITILLSACATSDKDNVMHIERTLVAAAFKMRFADTPEKLDNIRLMAQREFVPHPEGEQVYYVYADATYCKCAYVGDEAAYQRFQKFSIQQQLAENKMQAALMNKEAAQMNQDAMMNWNTWGVMGPNLWY